MSTSSPRFVATIIGDAKDWCGGRGRKPQVVPSNIYNTSGNDQNSTARTGFERGSVKDCSDLDEMLGKAFADRERDTGTCETDGSWLGGGYHTPTTEAGPSKVSAYEGVQVDLMKLRNEELPKHLEKLRAELRAEMRTEMQAMRNAIAGNACGNKEMHDVLRSHADKMEKDLREVLGKVVETQERVQQQIHMLEQEKTSNHDLNIRIKSVCEEIEALNHVLNIRIERVYEKIGATEKGPEDDKAKAECAPKHATMDESTINIVVGDEPLSPSVQVDGIFQAVHSGTSTVPLRESVWDAALFVGVAGTEHPLIGEKRRGTDLVLVFAFCVTLLLKVSIVSVMIGNPAFFEFSVDMSGDDARKWREGSGQNIKYMDPVSQQTLTSGVCLNDPAVPYSAHQRLTLEEIDHYLSPFELIPALCHGDVLRLSIMLLWTLIVLDELLSSWAFIDAVLQLELHLPRWMQRWLQLPSRIRSHFPTIRQLAKGKSGLRHEPPTTKWEADTYIFETVNCMQLSCAIFAWWIRSVFAVSIGFVGNRWLSQTTSITDLVLNGSALAFVFSIDELVYNICIPQRVRSLMRLVAPMHTGQRHYNLKGFEFRCVFCVGVAIFVVCFMMLATGTKSRIQEVREELCL